MPFGVNLPLDKMLKMSKVASSSQEEKDQNGNKKNSINDDIKNIKNVVSIVQKIVTTGGGGLGLALGIFAFIVIFLFFFQDTDTGTATNGGGGASDPSVTGTPGGNTITPAIPGFTLKVTGPSAPVVFPGEIVYTISFTHDPTIAPPLDTIEIFSNIPTNATFAGSSGEPKNTAGNPLVWALNNPANKNGFTVTFKPNADNIYVDFTATARVIGTGGGTGNLSNLLPPTTESTPAIDSQLQAIAQRIKSLPDLVSAYQAAANITGVPWQILAGIHYREGSLNPNGSLVSGRPIGTNEPDVVAGGGCSGATAPGKPIPLAGGGCGFNTFADSAIYAANHLKDKVGGIPTSFQELVKALSKDNGGGNSNCGEGVTYNYCPPDFYGEDDPYAMNLFDKKHEQMFVIFCADFTRCSPPRPDSNLGTVSVILALSKYF